MNQRDVSFFRPLWIRVLVTAIVAVWFVLEAAARFLSSKDTMRRLLEEMVRLGEPPKE